MDAQQIMAVLDQILIPVFVFVESSPDGFKLSELSFSSATLLWPRVHSHGYSPRTSKVIVSLDPASGALLPNVWNARQVARDAAQTRSRRSLTELSSVRQRT